MLLSTFMTPYLFAACPKVKCVLITCQSCKGSTCTTLGKVAQNISQAGQEIQGTCYQAFNSYYTAHDYTDQMNNSTGTPVNGIDARKDGKCTGELITSNIAKCE